MKLLDDVSTLGADSALSTWLRQSSPKPSVLSPSPFHRWESPDSGRLSKCQVTLQGRGELEGCPRLSSRCPRVPGSPRARPMWFRGSVLVSRAGAVSSASVAARNSYPGPENPGRLPQPVQMWTSYRRTWKAVQARTDPASEFFKEILLKYLPVVKMSSKLYV